MSGSNSVKKKKHSLIGCPHNPRLRRLPILILGLDVHFPTQIRWMPRTSSHSQLPPRLDGGNTVLISETDLPYETVVELMKVKYFCLSCTYGHAYLNVLVWDV